VNPARWATGNPWAFVGLRRARRDPVHFADELGKDKPLELGIGDGRLTAIGTAPIIGLVVYLWRTKVDGLSGKERAYRHR
jgi:hypothetical protein